MPTFNADDAWKKFNSATNDEAKNEACNELAAIYFQYVINISNSLSKSLNFKVRPDELASHGVDGLYKAIKRYDPSRGIKFETYAYPRIWGSMIDGIRSEDWVPRSVRMRQTMIENTKNRMEQETGRKMSDAEVLEAVGINEVDYHKNVKKFSATTKSSIEHCNNPDMEESQENKKDFNKYLVAKNLSSADSKLLRKEFLNKLMGKGFTKQERNVIILYYYESRTMKEIARMLDMSESRVSQVHQKVLTRLRKKVKTNAEYFEDGIFSIMHKCNDKDSL